MSGSVEHNEIRDLVVRGMRIAWIYGYMEASIELFHLLKKRRTRKFLEEHFDMEFRKEDKYEQSICHQLWEIYPKEASFAKLLTDKYRMMDKSLSD